CEARSEGVTPRSWPIRRQASAASDSICAEISTRSRAEATNVRTFRSARAFAEKRNAIGSTLPVIAGHAAASAPHLPPGRQPANTKEMTTAPDSAPKGLRFLIDGGGVHPSRRSSPPGRFFSTGVSHAAAAFLLETQGVTPRTGTEFARARGVLYPMRVQ